MVPLLLVVVGLLLHCLVHSALAVGNPTILSDWMAQYSDLFNQTLSQVTLPGSHDSGSYKLSTDVGVLNTGDPVINELIELANKLGLPIWEVLMPWSITQGNATVQSVEDSEYSTVYNQAMLGMRYFDLRLAYVTAQTTWTIQHGLLGADIRTCLTDLATFLTKHQVEFVIVEMGHVEFVNQTNDQALDQASNPAYAQLLTIIQSILGDWLVPCDQIGTRTVTQLIKAKQRVLVAVDPEILASSNITNICDASQVLYNSYADTPDVSKMTDYNNQIIAQFNKQPEQSLNHRHRKQPIQQANSQLWKVSYILTPDTDTIIESVIPGFPHSLLDLAESANKKLDSFMQSVNSFGYQAGNIVLIDDAVNTSVVQEVIANMMMRQNKTAVVAEHD